MNLTYIIFLKNLNMLYLFPPFLLFSFPSSLPSFLPASFPSFLVSFLPSFLGISGKCELVEYCNTSTYHSV